MKLWMKVTMLALCCASMVFTACKDANEGYSLVAGTLDGPLVSSSAPASVHEAMKRAERYHNYEIMSDSANAVCVEAIAEVGDISTEGYGIVVVKGDISTTFPDICNARAPMARYDEQSNTLWLTSSAVWGTGIQVDWLYQIGFGDNGIAYIVHTIDPYDIQQQLCQRLGYRIKGEQITLYDGEREIAQATNTVADMGGFDSEQPVWIGEQIQYDLSGDAPCLLVTPGVNFTTGLVLTYDDMPTLTAPITIGDDGKVNIGELNEYKE